MGLALTQVVTEDRASGAQIIDGSLKFDSGSSHYLSRTPGSAGNQQVFTISFWVKRQASGAEDICTGDDQNGFFINFQPQDGLYLYDFNAASGGFQIWSARVFRDTSAWYHIVVAVDSTQATDSNRVKVYINGEQENLATWNVGSGASRYPTQNANLDWNNTNSHEIGTSNNYGYLDGYLTEFYNIDGSALDASYFGFTDPLTNTWRPKKYTGTYGTNGFWLPLDGNSPIGEDKSGNGNNWTPVNFGGSNTIEKATGALPILNTTNGGNVATVGTRTDSDSSSLVLALPLVGNSTDIHHIIKGSGSAKAITENGNVAATNTQSNFYGGSFTFDGTGDYLTTPANTDFDFGTGAYTIEMWLRTTQDSGWLFYNATNDTGMRLCVGSNGTNSSNAGKIEFNEQVSNGDDAQQGTSRVDDGRWHHIAVCRGSSGGTRLYVDGNLEVTGSAGRNFDNDNLVYIGARNSLTGSELNGQLQDLRVYKGVAKYTSNFIPASTDPDILPDTPSGVAGGSALTSIPDSTTEGAVVFDGVDDYLRIDRGTNTDFEFGTGDFTIEFWAYIAGSDDDVALSTVDNGSYTTGGWLFESNQQFRISNSSGTYETWGTFTYPLKKWIHVAVSRSGSTGYGFIDGIQQFSFSTSIDNGFGGTNDLSIGSRTTTTNLRTQVISNLRIIKGTGLYTSNFTPSTTPLTNVTNTVLLCCQSNTSATAAAVTPSAIEANGGASATTFSPFLKENINTVRGQESGWCTLNPIARESAGGGGQSSAVTLSNGNLSASNTADSGVRATITVSSGKWYYEATKTSSVEHADGVGWQSYTSGDVHSVYYRDNGADKTDTVNSSAGTWATFTNGDVIGTTLDLDTNTIKFYKNGVFILSKTANTSATEPWGPGLILRYSAGSGAASSFDVNFGQKPFKYAPPEGFKTLCLANLPRPTEAAVRPDKYVGIVTYTGNNGTQTITGLGFDPGLVWIKNRTNDNNNMLFDVIRGTDNALISNTNAAEGASVDGTLSAFGSDGFTVYWDGQAGTGGNTNQSANNYVAWCWKAGGAAVSNTDGSITSSVSANQDAGFSVVTFTGDGTSGATVGHGLNAVPGWFVVKSRSNAHEWIVYHKAYGATKYTVLQDQNAATTYTPHWNDTEPTSTVFTVGNAADVNGSSKTFVAYCFAEVEGYSKFGSYTGNGSSDGPFIHCGFRPAMVIMKNISTSLTNWTIRDSARAPYNKVHPSIYVNLDSAEINNFDMDFVSNGFKIRDDNGVFNTSGDDYIFMAWAEAPTNNLFGGQANAR